MPYKNIEDERSAARRRYATDPEVKRKALAASARWEEEHKDERNEYRAKWARDHRFKNYADAREYEFAREMKKYGTTIEWYKDRLIAQNGLCALCEHLSHHHGTIQRLQVDHSHECCDVKTKSCGKCLRGLLCADCNILLSYLEKFLKEGSIVALPGTWLSKALKYLTQYSVSTQETQ